LIGDQEFKEGGFAHLGLHGLVGCISAAATGADCAAGALGGIVQSVYAGTLEGKGPAREDYASDEAYAAAYNDWKAKVATNANLIGGVVGYALSGGSAANVSATASIAKSGILNNYLWHQQAYMLEQAKSDLAACEVGGSCSDEELAFYRGRISYFEELDAFTDQQLRAECSADSTSAACKAYVADALCAAESRSSALCGGVPGFGVERWGYRSPDEMWKANMFASGRDYMAGFGIAFANLQHQQDTLDLLAEFTDSVNAVRGFDSIGIAIEMGVGAIGAGVAGRIPKGGTLALVGSFGERQFLLSRAELEGLLSSPGGIGVRTNSTVTEFVDGVTVTDIRTGKTFTGTVDLRETLNRIENAIPFPHRNDGTTFKNRPLTGQSTPQLPVQPSGYYTEYVHPTTGINGVGPQRIVTGNGGEIYYTPDHYETFIRLDH